MFCIPAFSVVTPTRTLVSRSKPTTAGMNPATIINSYPASGQVIYANMPVNFTTTVQNVTALPSEWTQASCLLTNPNGTTYSNTSIVTGNYNYLGASGLCGDSF